MAYPHIPLRLTCVCGIMHIDAPAGVGAPPLDTHCPGIVQRCRHMHSKYPVVQPIVLKLCLQMWVGSGDEGTMNLAFLLHTPSTPVSFSPHPQAQNTRRNNLVSAVHFQFNQLLLPLALPSLKEMQNRHHYCWRRHYRDQRTRLDTAPSALNYPCVHVGTRVMLMWQHLMITLKTCLGIL